jgi:hypothetical protein
MPEVMGKGVEGHQVGCLMPEEMGKGVEREPERPPDARGAGKRGRAGT